MGSAKNYVPTGTLSDGDKRMKGVRLAMYRGRLQWAATHPKEIATWTAGAIANALREAGLFSKKGKMHVHIEAAQDLKDGRSRHPAGRRKIVSKTKDTPRK